MPYETIQVAVDASTRVATVTLNRPDKLNSFTRAMHRELAEALDHIGFPNAGFVLQGNKESTFMNLVEVVIAPRPCIHVNHAVRSHRQMAGVTDAIGEDDMRRHFCQRRQLAKPFDGHDLAAFKTQILP